MAKKKLKKDYQYYLNPITDELVILDVKSNEIIAAPMIEEVSYEGKPYTEGEEKKFVLPPTAPTTEKRKKRITITKEIRDKAMELVKDGGKPFDLMKELGIGGTAAGKLYREFKKEIQKNVGKP